MKVDLNGRQHQWKTTSMEDDFNGRRPQWKTTSMEDDLNGRRPQYLFLILSYKNNIMKQIKSSNAGLESLNLLTTVI